MAVSQRKYDKLMHSVKTEDYYKIPLENRVNCYTCEKCGHITKTRDVDAGVTPMMINCEKETCQNTAVSSFYNDIAPHLEPTQEWFRPTFKQLKKLSEGMQNHVINGGLEIRKIVKDEKKN